MAKIPILDLLSNLTKDELKDIAEYLGVKKLSVSKIILVENILQIVKVKDIKIILDYLYKDTLKWLNETLDLPVSNRNNDVLKQQIYDYYNTNVLIDVKNQNISLKPDVKINKKTTQNNIPIVKEKINLVINHTNINKIIIELEYFNEDHLKKSVDETHLRDILLRHVNSHYGTAQAEYRIGGYFDLLIDIDISDGVYGLEVKKWNSLKSSSAEMTRAIGQAYIYSKKRYKEKNFSFVIFGVDDDKKNQRFLDFEKIINELNGTVIFKSVSK